MRRVIGIDFGTSTTYMNVKRYNGNKAVEDQFSYMPVVFNYGESSGFVSSIVRENEDGTLDFGEKAIEQLEGSKIHKEVKMYLESPDEEKRTEARRITEQFFKFLYETYKQQVSNLGSADDEEETIVSYPVKWQLETVQFMLDAARKAGFQNVHGMDEATAAVFAMLCYNDNNKLIFCDKPGYIMLVDMGAGTTDLVVCKYYADAIKGIRVDMVTSWPRTVNEPTFGGREIDVVLEKYVEDYLTKALVSTLAPQAHVIASTPGQAKMWKERNVSVNLSANKQVNTCAYIGVYKNMGMLNGEFPAFGRKEFEKIAEKELDDYVQLLSGCLADTVAKDKEFESVGLDIVILTGGHSAWYFAREIIDGTMEGYLEHPSLEMVRRQKARVVNLPNPQTTVSLGLVYSKLPFELSNIDSKCNQIDRKQSIEMAMCQAEKFVASFNLEIDNALNELKIICKTLPKGAYGQIDYWKSTYHCSVKKEMLHPKKTAEAIAKEFECHMQSQYESYTIKWTENVLKPQILNKMKTIGEKLKELAEELDGIIIDIKVGLNDTHTSSDEISTSGSKVISVIYGLLTFDVIGASSGVAAGFQGLVQGIVANIGIKLAILVVFGATAGLPVVVAGEIVQLLISNERNKSIIQDKVCKKIVNEYKRILSEPDEVDKIVDSMYKKLENEFDKLREEAKKSAYEDINQLRFEMNQYI